MPEWLALKWFTLSQFRSYDWGTYGIWFIETSFLGLPLAAYCFLLVPVIFVIRHYLFVRYHGKLEVSFSDRIFRSDFMTLLRHLPKIFLTLAIWMLMIALLRPQTTDAQTERWSEGIDIMIALDISESMEIMDFKPNRLESAKEKALQFIEGRFQDRIGIVVFSGEAFSHAPLTTDYELLKKLIQEIDFDMIRKGGTAIGSALGVSTLRLKESDSKSKVVILLSDGENTAGNITPEYAAGIAKEYGIRIYSIGVGKDGKVPYGRDAFGQTRYVENTLNEATLRQIAEICDGQFFRAENNEALDNIFSKIDELEKTEIKENRYTQTTDFYYIYMIWGLVFLCIWHFLRNTRIGNALVD